MSSTEEESGKLARARKREDTKADNNAQRATNTKKDEKDRTVPSNSGSGEIRTYRIAAITTASSPTFYQPGIHPMIVLWRRILKGAEAHAPVLCFAEFSRGIRLVLLELCVENYAVIDSWAVEFAPWTEPADGRDPG
jgi:hypothetical protein